MLEEICSEYAEFLDNLSSNSQTIKLKRSDLNGVGLEKYIIEMVNSKEYI